MNEQPARETFFGGCPHDCPDTCAMIYEVEDGRLVEVRGNKEHPMTRGGLCVKLKDYHDHHYNPDRVLYPLRRVGPKGSRQFERMSWDDAITEITARWKDIIAKHGSEAIMPYSYLGNEGLVQGLTAGDAFFNRLGSTVNEKTFCASGSSTAWLLTVGPTGGVDPESFAHSKYIVIWACNSISTNLHHWPFVLEARKAGAKIVVIDSFRSRTAKQADWHIAPKPGTDGALAMGIIAALIRGGHVDEDWVAKHTVGYPELAERAADFTPDYVEQVTGVAAEDIEKFAREQTVAERGEGDVHVNFPHGPPGRLRPKHLHREPFVGSEHEEKAGHENSIAPVHAALEREREEAIEHHGHEERAEKRAEDQHGHPMIELVVGRLHQAQRSTERHAAVDGEKVLGAGSEVAGNAERGRPGAEHAGSQY